MTTDTRYTFSLIRERMRQHPRPVLDFAYGNLGEPVPAEVLELVRGQPESMLERCPRSEMAGFAEDAAALLADELGVRVLPTSILATPGGRAAMSGLAAVSIEPGASVLVTEPGYPAFARVASQQHAALRAVPLDPGRGFEPDLSGLGQGEAPLSVVGLNYPNNPTGAVPSEVALRRIRLHTEAATLWFNDATYAFLCHAERPFSILHTAWPDGTSPRAVELYTLAKQFALGPLAVAFLAGDEETIAAVRDYGEFATAPLSTLHVKVARACLAAREEIRRTREAVGERLQRLRLVLDGLGFETFPVDGGLYQLVRAPSVISDHPVSTAAEAADCLLSDYDLAVVPWDSPPHAFLRFSSQYLDDELTRLEALRGMIVSTCHV